ncbi:unnamed protein product [Darwinula stevensoni]|uniref:Receptor expression-enhancing protein n=1 Tax=Darwinula stevensoni TaxID=69355 RepID=A0A7R8X8D9_9CRUS|nr:unnamed protein product [Darwinula stevensoni]CAG0884369.1 unnamed protein product [Darwinula stevensoni]
MEALKKYISLLDKQLEKKCCFNDILKKAEEKTKVKRIYLVIGTSLFLALYLMYGYAAELICNSIGFIYPAYASVKAIESKNKDDDTQWLIYWVVFAVFSCLEFFSDILLSWFPFYWLFKCVFLIWCFVPIQNNGAHLMYYKFIRPYILRHQDKVDKALSDATQHVSDFARRKAQEFGSDQFKGD